MKQELEHLYGLKLSATDSEIGKVKDFYFDDMTWSIRYLVVDTGGWLLGRQVLLSPHAFGEDALDDASGDATHIRVNLTRKQIEDSPAIETHRTVTRQYEEQYYSYYGWPNYWNAGMLGATGFTALPPVLERVAPSHHGHNQRDDIHLRSSKAVTGYHVMAANGDIGKVHGFVIDDKNWTLSEVIIKLSHPSKNELLHVQTRHVTRIDYNSSSVSLDLAQDKLTAAMDHALATATPSPI